MTAISACETANHSNASPPQPAVSSNYKFGHKMGAHLTRLHQENGQKHVNETMKGFCDGWERQGNASELDELCARLSSESSLSENKKHLSYTVLDDYAELNAMRKSVVVLPSKVQYEILKKGSGAKPVEDNAILVSYRAYLPDGNTFDTTYEDGEPLKLNLTDIAIPGLREALMLMPEGSHWRVVIPPEMGFGRSGNNKLRRRIVIYEIELISIEAPATAVN
ncbi:MAG: hypothetical protein GY744_01905 [Gammaproteobacteria bacterium]|nr:hypothetical protein [Gammaproteobacteria bacterium]